MDGIECNNSPVLILAEGLLMYLREQDIKTLFLKMRDKFKEVTLIFDAYCENNSKTCEKSSLSALFFAD